MMTTGTDEWTADVEVPEQPGAVVRVTAIVMAVWCLGFAAVNVVFEITEYFASLPISQLASRCWTGSSPA